MAHGAAVTHGGREDREDDAVGAVVLHQDLAVPCVAPAGMSSPFVPRPADG